MFSLKKYFSNMLIRKSVLKIIYRSEIQAPEIGVSSMQLLGFYATEMKQDKKLYQRLTAMRKKLDKGTPKDVVYGEYLDDDIKALFKDSIQRQIPPAEIFSGYVPFKELGEKSIASVKKKLYVPLGIFVLVTFALNETVGNFLEIGESGLVKFSPIMSFLMEHYLMANLLFGAFVGYWLIVKPENAPIVKKVFHKIKGMLALSTVKTMNAMGYQSDEIMKTLTKQFPKNKKNKKGGRKKDIDALLSFLRDRDFVTLIQSAELKMRASREEVEVGIEEILNEKEDEIKDLNHIIDAVVSNVSLALLAPPLLIVVISLLELMVGVSSVAAQR